MTITKYDVDRLLREMRRQSREPSKIRESLHEILTSSKQMNFDVRHMHVPNV